MVRGGGKERDEKCVCAEGMRGNGRRLLVCQGSGLEGGLDQLLKLNRKDVEQGRHLNVHISGTWMMASHPMNGLGAPDAEAKWEQKPAEASLNSLV